MSFLAPLYIAGILAVSLPIVFHLIRRTPHGRQTFSSLLFLAPSPPRLTRRSRLNNLLLLILRGLALSLLAFAFARPLFYQQSDMNVNEAEGRRIALLVDTSASMRRGDLWSQAIRRVEKVLDELTPTDEVALFTFDQQVRPLVSLEEWNEQAPSQRAALVRSRLATVEPTWGATNLGEALATVADALSDADASRTSAPDARRQIVLISDLQQGSHIESLQGYEWPSGVLVDVQTVAASDPTNAAVALVEGAGDDESSGDERLRIRVSNEAESQREQFLLAWANEQGALATSEPVKAYVPPGQSRIVRIAWPKGEPVDRLVLAGDGHDFDNMLYLVALRQEQMRLVFIGDDEPGDTKGLLYYLAGAVADTPRRKVELITRKSKEALTSGDLLEARLVVVSTALSEAESRRLRAFIGEGGAVLVVLKDAAAGATAARLMERETLEVEEAPGRDFALLGRVKFDHPIFAAFADPRFADFTKIHFWKHRRVRLNDEATGQVLASFDDGDPFLIEKTIGKGRLLVAASGWHPADSQLALSTKFVPLVAALFPRAPSAIARSQRTVLEKIELPPAADAAKRVVRRPDGAQSELAASSTSYDAADEPGIFRLALGSNEIPLAFNIAADESRTAALAIEELEQRGARIGTQPTAEQLAERQRELRLFELENRQKLWRWIIAGVLGILLVETALAGRLAHRTFEQQVAA